MRFLKRIAGFLGFVKDEVRDQQEADDDDNQHHQPCYSSNYQESGLPCKGFSVPVHVAVDRPQPGPILVPSSSGDGGVQGLRWHAKRLKIDEDGDVADEFLDEVLPETSSIVDDHHRSLPRFEVKLSAQPAKIKNQVISHDGRIQQCVEYQGRLNWI